MSPSDGSETNPYAAPISEVTAARHERRPAAVKWAIGFLIFDLACQILLEGKYLVEEGWSALVDSYRTDLPSTFEVASRILGLVMVIGPRRTLAYGVGVIVLGWECLLTPFTFWNLATRFEPLFSGIATAGIIFTSLLVWLFIRFTFGRPSRQYFRVAKS